jgi:hypothetical protein
MARHSNVSGLGPFKDFRRDWQNWSPAERFTVTLAGTAALYLAFVTGLLPAAMVWPF